MVNRPKRRKDKYNPYDLIDNNEKKYIFFLDSKKEPQKIEVSEEIFEVFNYYELRDLSQMNEYDNHIEHSEIYENNLNKRAKEKEISLEDYIIQKYSFLELKKAIDELPAIQRERIKKYYFEEKNEYEIAEEEGVSHQAIHIGLDRARKKLKEILEKNHFYVCYFDY